LIHCFVLILTQFGFYGLWGVHVEGGVHTMLTGAHVGLVGGGGSQRLGQWWVMSLVVWGYVCIEYKSVVHGSGGCMYVHPCTDA
jgi:hypothetical protein